nr:MAG TPA_asm: Type II secretion system, protein M [Caudoviricetes sp.]
MKQLRTYWPFIGRADKALIIILGATALLTLVFFIAQPSFRGLGATLSTTAIWLLTVGLAIREVEARLLRHTIKALLELIGRKANRHENQ